MMFSKVLLLRYSLDMFLQSRCYKGIYISASRGHFSLVFSFFQLLYSTMSLVRLIADLQANPRSVAIYRKFAAELKQANRIQEAEAIEALIKNEFNVHDTSTDEEQRKDH